MNTSTTVTCNHQRMYISSPKHQDCIVGFNFCRGEEAFCALQGATRWTHNPMLKRISDLPEHVPMTLIYGSRTWVDITQGIAVKEQRTQSYCDVQVAN